jgi:hypothetical protein
VVKNAKFHSNQIQIDLFIAREYGRRNGQQGQPEIIKLKPIERIFLIFLDTFLLPSTFWRQKLNIIEQLQFRGNGMGR